MAKKIIQSNYTIDASANTIVWNEYVKKEEIYLITDVDTGTVLVNFSDPELAVNSWTWDEPSEKLTITTTANLTSLGVTDNSKIQIIVERPYQEIEVADSLLDPVHKIRVSTPENLIDTDFEYGLQPTKWETLELSQNYPSFYVADGDSALTIVQDVTAVAGSDLITVTCSDEHGLVLGTPIDVQGLTSRTAEGKFLIKSADTTSFVYQANASQTVTGSVGSIYTTVTPGQFYSGSQITYDTDTGVETDGQPQSKLSIETPNPHGFVDGSNFYLVNTVATKTLKITDTTSSDAPDARPYVDFADTITVNPTIDQTLTETKAFRPPHSIKFDASAVNVAGNSIVWTNHRMRDNDVVLYVPPSGDTAIGGLDRFDFYYVIKVDEDNIQLSATRNGSAINFNNTGSYNYGRALIGMVYELWAGRGNYRDNYGYGYTTAYYNNGVGSGWDMDQYDADAQAFGLSGGASQSGNLSKVMLCGRTNTQIEDFLKDVATYSYRQDNTNYTFPETSTTPNRWNFIEDQANWSDQWSTNIDLAGRAYTNKSWRFRKSYGYNGGFRYFGAYYGNRDIYVVPLIEDDEADTFHSANFELDDGDSINLTISSGDLKELTGTANYNQRNNILEATASSGAYTVEKVGTDRFRLLRNGTRVRIREATGVYSFSGTTDNNLSNTFYLPEHGLTDTSELTIDASLGTLPSVASGTITPINGETNSFEFKLLEQAVTNWLATQTGFENIYTSSTPELGYITTTVAPGRTDNFSYISTNGIQTRFWSDAKATWIYQNVNPNDLDDETIYYPFEDTIHEDWKPAMVATEWQSNAAIPFWMTMYKATEFSGSYFRFMHYLYAYTAGSSPSVPSSYQHYLSHTGPNNDWYYTHAWCRVAGSGDTDMLLMTVKLRNRSIWNSNAWMRAFNSINSSRSYPYLDEPMNDGDIMFNILLSMDDGVLWDNTKARDLITDMIDYYDSNLEYPALTDQTQYDINVKSSDRISLKDKATGLELNLTNSGAANLSFITPATVGIVDGSYSAIDTQERHFNFQTNFQVEPVTYTVNAATGITQDVDLGSIVRIVDGHNLQNGAELLYDNNSNSDIGGLSNNTSYYVILLDEEYIQLAASEDDAASGTAITLTAGTGNHKFASQTISGIAEAAGTINTEEASDVISGNGTLFKRYFKVGDSIFLKDNTNTPGELNEYTVRAIADDASMQVDRVVGFDSTNSKHFTTTNLYARPDGFSVHRPFDGGVEIAAGTAPFSSIRRQTRKYFRYQSGKGIQTSVAINFNPPVTLESLTGSGLTATAITKYPHRLNTGMAIRVKYSSDSAYNGTFVITKVDEFTFTYTLEDTPITEAPNGIIKFNVASYTDAATRVGMFDQQNGFFFEYDGNQLYCVRRSSTTQISGTANVNKNSNLVTGNGTNFSGQLNVGDYVVLRGQSYKVIKINSKTEMYIAPEYRGVSTSNIVITLTEDLKIPQSEWNLDKCDGSGLEGFVLDIDSIQMAYMDYSWYGAGKIRFGFKDRKGHVRYVHEFLHNNRLDEAYMRSGNMAAAYEVINGENPTYAPTLFHWGTSVIMDGTFDEDEAYLFTATSKSLSFTNGQNITATTTGNSDIQRYYNRSLRNYDFYVRIPFSSNDASKLSGGSSLYTTGEELKGEEISWTYYSGSTVYAMIYIGSGSYYNVPAVYPVVNGSTTVYIGQDPNSTDNTVNLGTDLIPLVTLRLAPSVDSGISGFLGERDIINRMQLRLSEVGLILSHECEVKLILNGDLSLINWENVNSPSLSQLQKHNSGEKVTGGVEIFSFRASGGTTDATTNKRLSASTNFSLEQIIDMGNSILGGDGVFPNGPDILTLAVEVVDTADINATTPFVASGRITWSESQA